MLHKYICLLLLIVIPHVMYADPPLPTPIGRVVWVKGVLKALMNNQETRSLQKTSLIYLHDTLITEKDSQGQVVFTDGSLMTLAPDTKFSIDNYSFKSQKKSSDGSFIMNVIQGGFRTITGLIAKQSPSNYSVKTPVATIGVRGTDYQVLFTNNELYIRNISGTPCLQNNYGFICLARNKSFANVSQGKAPIYIEQNDLPPEMQNILEVIPASIQQFQDVGGGVQGYRGSSGSRQRRGGATDSFCITN